ncbi:MAG: biotin--[acetyl-CoA-carboxylase] ligase [Nitrososphaerota archaeon]|nr:biotin--[acetyl-CoA-carboxylase] ligase [Nitrososphaerota archaeon]
MIRWFVSELEEVGSTQVAAIELASHGAREGTVIAAKTQFRGVGRHNREWKSPAGGLYMSLVLRPRRAVPIALVPLISGLSVVKGVFDATGLRASIRWPNDVMVGYRKLAGTIAHSEYAGHQISYLVIGVGVNVNVTPREVSRRRGGTMPTSIAMELGRRVEIGLVRWSILRNFSYLYSSLIANRDLIGDLRAYTTTIGRRIRIKRIDQKCVRIYTAEDLATDGSLMVRHAGRVSTLRPEDIEWMNEEQPQGG